MKTRKMFMVAALAALVLVAPQVMQAQVQRAQNFILLIDQSNEMNATYHQQSKNFIAREMADSFLKHVPTNVPVNGGMWEYGIMAAKNENRVLKIKSLGAFNTNDYIARLDRLKPQMGPSTLSIAIREARQELDNTPGTSAVIIISGGNLTDIGEPSTEVKNLKKTYGDNLCVYTILVGKSKRGGEFLQELVEKGGCGLAATSDSLNTDIDMARFVKYIFFQEVGDSDKDGVPDTQDKCPGTPFGARVDYRGCWTLNDVNFDTGKAEIKPQYFYQLDQIASVMNANPGLRVSIEGHTDSDGDDASNQTLSEMRALSVRDFLIKAEVDPARLTAVGMGERYPIDTNNTAQGKARNRRIEFVIR